MKYPHLAAQLFNCPLLVHPQKLDAIIAGLGGRLLGGPVIDDGVEASAEQLPRELFSTRRGERSDNGYAVTDGVAVIFASGALVHRTRFQAADSSYMLGYNTLASQLEAAMADPEVHAIVQIWDSPGGEVAGAFEYADRVFAQRGRKPMKAIADSMSASAAYLGGSAFDELAITSTGYAGSIGVVMRHVDWSGALAKDGIRVTHIFAGDHKVDGNPFGPLPAAVAADLQAEINGIYDQFVAAVSRHTGLSIEAVRATQARTYRGEAAQQAGLVSRVTTADALISELAAMRSRPHSVGQTARSTTDAKGDTSMSGTEKGGQAAAQAPTSEQLEAARAEGYQRGLAEGRQAGAAAETERVRAVFAQGEGMKGHEALVMQLALDGKTTGDGAAAAILAAERAATAAAAAAHRGDAPPAAKTAAAPAAGDGKDTAKSIAARAVAGLAAITNRQASKA